MAFSNVEKINHVSKLSLQINGSADDSPSQKQWYAEENSFNFIIDPILLWNQISFIPGASTPSEADAAVILQPTILESKKIKLTVDPASNNRSYEARLTFGDRTSNIVGNWIQPSLIRKNGGPSQGYIVRLFAGDPDGMSYTELPTSFHSGSDGSCSWQWNYASGILLVSTDESSTYGGLYTSDGLYIKGYRYIGSTGGGGSSGGTLEQAYNYGGPGSGRSITVLPNKPVEMNEIGRAHV